MLVDSDWVPYCLPHGGALGYSERGAHSCSERGADYGTDCLPERGAHSCSERGADYGSDRSPK